MNAGEQQKSILAFFLLAILLILPFLVLGAATGIMLAPGLPVAALGAFCPMLAAVILAYRENKGAGVWTLLKRAFDLGRVKSGKWYLPTLLIMPAAMALSFWVLRLSGVPLPAPQVAILPTLALCAATFVGALGEELGWSGYALEPMQARWGALKASIVLGGFWAVYHYAGLLQAHRSVEWIAWWTLETIALRVILVWLYNNTGKSVFATAMFHMTINVTWLSFPVEGSYFDPRITGIILALTAAVIIALWEPQTLARYKYGPSVEAAQEA